MTDGRVRLYMFICFARERMRDERTHEPCVPTMSVYSCFL